MTSVDGANRKALLDRRRVLLEQPDVRWINLIETDGVSTTSRKHLVMPLHLIQRFCYLFNCLLRETYGIGKKLLFIYHMIG
jgi:hypothetical protein